MNTFGKPLSSNSVPQFLQVFAELCCPLFVGCQRFHRFISIQNFVNSILFAVEMIKELFDHAFSRIYRHFLIVKFGEKPKP